MLVFVPWVVFVKAMFSCLNLKPDDGDLSYNMSEVCNKAGHALTNVIIVCDELKPVFHPEFVLSFFFEQQYVYLLRARAELKAPPCGACAKNVLKSFE